MSIRFRIAFSAACAALAVMACLTYASGVREEADRVRSEVLERYGGEVVMLVVASGRLEPGDVVSQSNVSMREWVADLAPDGALTSMGDALGREVGVATEKGSPLTQLTFRSSSDLADVPEGHVALSIPLTDKLGVPRGISQGASLVAYAVTSEGTRLVSGQMTVLAAPVTTTLGTGGQLTVALLPEDVPQVLSASASGDLRLVMPAPDTPVVGTQPPAAIEDVEEASGDEALASGGRDAHAVPSGKPTDAEAVSADSGSSSRGAGEASQGEAQESRGGDAS